MQRVLRIFAALLAGLSLAAWLTTGANLGWTKTSVPVRVLDEVTGIEAVQYEQRFVMGLELLAAAWITAGLLAGASLLLKKQTLQQQPN